MDEARLFLVVCSDRTRSNSLKLEHRKFHTNTGKNFSTVRVTELCNRLHRGVVDALSLEAFKTEFDGALGSLIWWGQLCPWQIAGTEWALKFHPT